MKLTKKQTVGYHRMMWNWIADETDRRGEKISEDDYFKEYDIMVKPYKNSYCCDYAEQNRKWFELPCSYCPLDWDNTWNCCEDGGLYYQWENTDDPHTAAKLAREIANTPGMEDDQERTDQERTDQDDTGKMYWL